MDKITLATIDNMINAKKKTNKNSGKEVILTENFQLQG